MFYLDILIIILGIVFVIIGVKKGFLFSFFIFICLFLFYFVYGVILPEVLNGIMQRFSVNQYTASVISYLLVTSLFILFLYLLNKFFLLMVKPPKTSLLSRLTGGIVFLLNAEMTIFILLLFILQILPLMSETHSFLQKNSHIYYESSKFYSSFEKGISKITKSIIHPQ